jgi:predicted nucleic acid-binding protein
MILLDSNLLLRLADQVSPQRPVARKAILTLHARHEVLAVVPQNLYEFWVVATRPTGKANGLGMPPERVELWLNYIQRRFVLLPESNAILTAWRSLMAQFRITGFRAHDARFVAAMRVHGIQRLLTFNAADFRPYAITVLDPGAVS